MPRKRVRLSGFLFSLIIKEIKKEEQE